jgi:hypothetical protein
MSESKDRCADVRELVPWYPSGTLAEDERRRVEQHASTCEACRALLDFSEEIRESMRAVRMAHPSPEVLVDFVERSSELSGRERDTIETHIMVCASCREQAELLEQLDREDARTVSVRRAPEGERPPLGRLARFWDSLKRGVLSPVPAAIYLVAAIAAVVSIFVLPGDHEHPNSIGTVDGVVIVPDEGDRVRQALQEPSAGTTVDATSTHLLLLELTELQSPPGDEDAYTVSFLPKGGGAPAFSTTVAGATFRDNYTIGVILRPGVLDVGDYVVTVMDPTGARAFHSTVKIRR